MALAIADNAALVENLRKDSIKVIRAEEFAKVDQKDLDQHELYEVNDGEISAFKVYRKGGAGTDKDNGRSFDYIIFYDAEGARPSGMALQSYFEPTLEGVKEFIDSWSI